MAGQWTVTDAPISSRQGHWSRVATGKQVSDGHNGTVTGYEANAPAERASGSLGRGGHAGPRRSGTRQVGDGRDNDRVRGKRAGGAACPAV